jgi:hypothetical protein
MNKKKIRTEIKIQKAKRTILQCILQEREKEEDHK